MNLEAKFGAVEPSETVVSGSFRKHMEEVGRALQNFQSANVEVLAPKTKEIADSNKDFVMLATDDPEKPPHKLEMDFMREIQKASFLYVADIDGYVGQSAATEMAYAKLKELPIIVAEPIKNFADEVPEEARTILKNITSNILPISDISKERIVAIKQKLEEQKSTDLSSNERKVLQALIKDLLKELWQLKKESF